MRKFCITLFLFIALFSGAQNNKLTTSHFVFDKEKDFTAEQINHYDSLIGNFAAKSGYYIYIITADSVEADQFKFLNEFENWDIKNADSIKAVIILLSRKQREYSVNATGNMQSLLTGEVLNRLITPAVPDLKKEQYFEAVLRTCLEIIKFLEEKDHFPVGLPKESKGRLQADTRLGTTNPNNHLT